MTVLGDVDAGRVRQIVANLVTNAHLYTGEGGSVKVRVEPERAWVQIAIQDSGVGMTDDERGRLFEPRQAASRSGGGLGFGMVWVRSWVRRAQGLIEVESKLGTGTTVNIRFQIDTQN